MEKIWFFIKSFRTKGKDDINYESGLFAGSFVELVLRIASENSNDENYSDFNLVNWKQLSREEYKRLDGQI